MISNDLIQAALITTLKADTALVDWLTARNAANEIRENEWQGAAFVYPAVRVEIGPQLPITNGVCHTTQSELTFSIISLSEQDSSQQATTLAGLVNAALFAKRISGTGFASLLIDSDGMPGATRTIERVWQVIAPYRVRLYET